MERIIDLLKSRGRDTLYRKRKAFTALYLFAVWQDQGTFLDKFLRVARTLQPEELWVRHVWRFFLTLLDVESHISLKRTALLASRYLAYWSKTPSQRWGEIASVFPKEDEVVPSVVDTLLEIACSSCLPQSKLSFDVWSWLTLPHSQPPTCKGRRLGSDGSVVRAVRDHKDIGVLMAYLLHVWSEWNSLNDPYAMECCIRGEFRGIGMHSHRTDLLKRLEEVLVQLGNGLGHLQEHRPELSEEDVQKRMGQYRKLRAILEEEDRKEPTCTSSRLIVLFVLLNPLQAHRNPLDIHGPAPHPIRS